MRIINIKHYYSLISLKDAVAKFLISILLIFGGFYIIRDAIGAELTLRDAAKNCAFYTIWNDHRQPDAISWSGRCENGKVEGLGTLTYFHRNSIIWIDEFKSMDVWHVSAGRAVYGPSVNENNLRLGDVNCGRYGMHSVSVFVPADWPTHNWSINSWLFRLGREYIQPRCEKKSNDYVVNVMKPDDVFVSYVRGYEPDRNRWREYDNRETNALRSTIGQKNVELERQRRQAARLQAEQERARAEAERIRQEKQRRATAQTNYNEFNKLGNVQQWTDVRSLFANPYALEGKMVAFICRFEQMIARQEALCSNGEHLVVVRGDTARNSGWLAVAGKFLEQKTVSVGFPGQLVVPVVELSHSWPCLQASCSDMLDY